MTFTPFYFRFYICVQIFITIERIIKTFFFAYGPLKQIATDAKQACSREILSTVIYRITSHITGLKVHNVLDQFNVISRLKPDSQQRDIRPEILPLVKLKTYDVSLYYHKVFHASNGVYFYFISFLLCSDVFHKLIAMESRSQRIEHLDGICGEVVII